MIQRAPGTDAVVATFFEAGGFEDSEVHDLASQMEELKGSRAWQFLVDVFERGLETGRRRLEDSEPLEAAQYAKQFGYLSGTRLFPELVESVIAHSADRVKRAADQEA